MPGLRTFGGALLSGGPPSSMRRVTLSADLLAVLACPESKAKLLYFAGGESGDDPAAAFLYCPRSRLRYRIEEGIPVLLIEEAERISEKAGEALVARAKALAIAGA